MRWFIVKMGIPLLPFHLKDLTVSRMDLVARCVNSALWLDKQIRRDTRISFLFDNAHITVHGDKIRGMRPDERNIASFFQKILQGEEISGITKERVKIPDNAFWLDKDGEDIEKVDIDRNIFVLGGHKGMKIEGKRRISIGPRSYLTSHCISFLNIWLDRERI